MSETTTTVPATPKQLDLLQALTGDSWRGLGLTKQEATDTISRLIDVKKEMGAEAAKVAGQEALAQYRDEVDDDDSAEAAEDDAVDAAEAKRAQQEQEAQAQQEQAPQGGTLEDAIVGIVKRRRDEVLDGIELGGGVREERKVLVIKRPDLPDTTVEGHQHQAFPELVEVLGQRDHVLTVGPAGTGKTSSGKVAAKALGIEWTYWACNPRVTASALLGYMDANGQYVRTQFRDAYEHGKLFILDEMDNAAADLLVALNGAIENGHAAFPDGIIERHPDFVVLGTANTYGKGANRIYAGRQQLDGATLDRFVTLDWGYDEQLERALAPVDDWTDYVQAVRKVVEEHAIREVVSMRASIRGGKYLGLGWSWKRVEETQLFRGWSTDALMKVEKVRSGATSMRALYKGEPRAKGA